MVGRRAWEHVKRPSDEIWSLACRAPRSDTCSQGGLFQHIHCFLDVCCNQHRGIARGEFVHDGSATARHQHKSNQIKQPRHVSRGVFNSVHNFPPACISSSAGQSGEECYHCYPKLRLHPCPMGKQRQQRTYEHYYQACHWYWASGSSNSEQSQT